MWFRSAPHFNLLSLIKKKKKKKRLVNVISDKMFAGAFIVRNVGMLQAQNLINFQLKERIYSISLFRSKHGIQQFGPNVCRQQKLLIYFFLLLFDIFQSHKQFPLSRGIHYAHLGAQLSTLQSCMTDFQPNVHIAVGQKTEQKQEWKRAKARHFFYIQVIQVASSCKLNAFSRQARILMGS